MLCCEAPIANRNGSRTGIRAAVEDGHLPTAAGTTRRHVAGRVTNATRATESLQAAREIDRRGMEQDRPARAATAVEARRKAIGDDRASDRQAARSTHLDRSATRTTRSLTKANRAPGALGTATARNELLGDQTVGQTAPAAGNGDRRITRCHRAGRDERIATITAWATEPTAAAAGDREGGAVERRDRTDQATAGPVVAAHMESSGKSGPAHIDRARDRGIAPR